MRSRLERTRAGLALLGGTVMVALAPELAAQTVTPDGARLALPLRSDSLVGVFEGRTPCGKLFVEFTGYDSPACEKVKWWLALYRDPAGEPGGYRFEGTRVTRTGAWAIERGTASQPDAVVYRLFTDLPVGSIALLRIDANILLLLDGDRRPMVGDASWSYTLSRTNRQAAR
ncbi:MAG TPA: hypothetical protein VMM12_14260 [Longimicrobiales bacterium]|nr:hypothetical protein [Longimicrobiales bacterium]